MVTLLLAGGGQRKRDQIKSLYRWKAMTCGFPFCSLDIFRHFYLLSLLIKLVDCG